MRPVTKISCGLKHCLVLTSNDKLFAWGSNLQCQLGRRLVAAAQGGQGSSQVLAFSNVPIEVAAYENAMPFEIASGPYHNIVKSLATPRQDQASLETAIVTGYGLCQPEEGKE